MIDLRDARIDHHLGVARDGHGAVEELGDEFLDQVRAALFRAAGSAPKRPSFDDLVEQALLD